MSSITSFIVLSIVFALIPSLSVMSASDVLPPGRSPDFSTSDICNVVEYGMGKCKWSGKNESMYECECNSGWKQTSFDVTTPALTFLPCVIPNCAINTSCSENVTGSGTTLRNASMSRPCDWANCGRGVCNEKAGLSYGCDCKDGYTNLLNNTVLPCVKDCSFEGDCVPTSPLASSVRGDIVSNQGKSLQHDALFNVLTGLLIISIARLLHNI